MDGMGCVKIMLLKIYGSFNDVVELRHPELLMSTEKLQEQTKLFHSQTH